MEVWVIDDKEEVRGVHFLEDSWRTWLTFGGVGPAQLTGAGKEWYDKYKTDHAGKDPAIYTSYGNASANVALAALQKAGTNDRYEVLKNVMATKDLATVLGTTSFDANGDAIGGSISGFKVETSWPPAFQLILSVKE